MTKSIKTLIPLNIKMKARMLLLKLKSNEKLGFTINSSKPKRVFFFLAADYGNLGDCAITYAQHKFLQDVLYPDFFVTQIPISKTLNGIECVRRMVNKDDIITTVGGGNMGDLYPMIELYRQLVIKTFKNNSIITFPQTADFESSKKLTEATKVYSKHKSLTLLAREQKTFDFFKKHFKLNNSILVPDIVLTLDKTEPKIERKGAIVCLRDDKEKKLNQDQENHLNEVINTNFKSVKIRDTHIGGENMSLSEREKALNSIWNDFKSAELVITDRLHGMIFCFITNTPALVFLNNNHKILSSFSWIKNAKHIKLIKDFSKEEIANSINDLKNMSGQIVKEDLTAFYKPLIEISSSKT